MCRSCARIGFVAPSTLAKPRRPCETRTVRAPRPLGNVTSSVQLASSIDDGGSDATPCDASVRFRSTGSPPAPTSGNSEIMGGVRVLGIDVGGTFTDAVFFRDGVVRTAKVPTAAKQEESVVAAARAVGAHDVERFTHGTTIATNALLERKGARTAFVTNAGFEHLLHLRRQNRADLYRLCAAHPEPLVPLERCAGVRGRLGPDGELEPLDLASLPDLDAEAVAICLLHAYRDPSHERASQRRCGGVFPMRTSSRRTRSRPSSASTSARRRRRSTRTSGLSSRATCARSPGEARRRDCRRRS